ncbi:DegT/DnrJ/EryC1/StrS family aminotransferase [Candidatus Woesearchaeota archaeon]|nr:DegT/DnrJ/EryC1/StrS family aminotransferase [Candidatus Woesearchaeota archaeon]
MEKPAIEGGNPVRKDFLVFGQPDVGEEEINEVVDSLRKRWLSTGPKVKLFAEQFNKFIGSGFSVPVNSCTAALHLSLIAAGIGPGDEVIVPSMTFAATANVVVHAGAAPILVDCQKDTMNIAPDAIEKALTKKTKAVIPVHFAGLPCDMDAIHALARKHALVVIEDAAHAVEAVYRGKKIGTLSKFTCFSFYATKNITTGEGGMVTTDDAALAEKIGILGLHGLSKGAWSRYSAHTEGFRHYEVLYPGYKYNMMDLQAAIGIHQLKKVNVFLAKREKIWKRYNDAFSPLPVFLPPEPGSGSRHSRHLYILVLDLGRIKVSRDRILDALVKEGIGTGVHYKALHLQPYYQKRFGLTPESFPNATFISERAFSLPLGPGMDESDIDDVITAVKKILAYYAR